MKALQPGWIIALGGIAVIALAAFARHWGFGSILFAPFCHQDAERCLAVGGVPMALCARCVGIAAGISIAGIAYPLFRYASSFALKMLALASLANLADVSLEHLGFYDNLIWARLALGGALGAALVGFILPHWTATARSLDS